MVAIPAAAAGAVGRGGLAANKVAETLFEQRAMSHRFLVHIDRSAWDLGSWTKVSGLTIRWNKHIYRTGESSAEHILPGNVIVEPLKLSRAACTDTVNVQKWLVQTTRHRRTYTGAVALLDFAGFPVMTWEFRELYPTSWSLGDLDSSSARPLIESLELTHSGFLADEGLVHGGGQ